MPPHRDLWQRDSREGRHRCLMREVFPRAMRRDLIRGVPTQAPLTNLLDALANGDADAAIADAFEALYPVSYDPESGVLADAVLN